MDPLDPTGAPWPPEPVPQPAVNRWLDRLASAHPPFVGADAPAYLVLGAVGIVTGFTVLVGLALARGVPLVFAGAYITLALLTFVLAAKLRQWISGREGHVLLEDVLLVLAATAAAAWTLREPVLASLDVIVVALGAFLVFGRLGCLTCGCCHGRPAALGIRYRAPAVEPPLVGVRLFPIQLVESLWTAVVTLIGMALLEHPPGTALSFWLIAYGAGRFVFEFVRGDLDRPRVGALTEAQWLAIALLIAAIVHQEVRAGWDPVRAAAAAGVALVALTGWLCRRRWLAPPRTRLVEDEVQEWERCLTTLEQGVAAAGRELSMPSPRPGVIVSLRIDRSDDDARLFSYLLSAEGGRLVPADAFLLGGMVTCRLPRHQVLRAEQDSAGLHLWVLVAGRPGAHGCGLLDHPRHVLYRARAFARSLECVERPRLPVPPPPAQRPASYFQAWPDPRSGGSDVFPQAATDTHR